jgi:transcriptional regulator with XRE-family HTH domain
MVETERVTLPQPEEGLANYIQRLRHQQLLTQKELSAAAGVHIQTIRKIESGHTARLNQKAKVGLSSALGIPTEYLDAAVKKIAIEPITSLKFCPYCGSNYQQQANALQLSNRR